MNSVLERKAVKCGFENLRRRKDGRYQCTVCEKKMHSNFEAEVLALLPPEGIKLFRAITAPLP